jgi:iron complex outermembrane receptor protein
VINTATIIRQLRAGSALPALALLGAGAAIMPMLTVTAAAQVAVPPAQTETAPNAQPAAVPNSPDPTNQGDPDATNSQDIVVTGSILRRTDTETPSPVTVITTENLDRRGLSTVQDALQTLSSNNGPALTNSFSANGAFAQGASAVSLRGLSTNSTLVLFDGLRAAFYPIADDGTRNFVDLNTIPDDIVERVEVLRDGASSSYGADAIAGVVNIITKKEFKGVGGRAEAGISERGDASQYRLSLTAGVGDLEDNGFNVYGSGFYYRSEALKNNKRRYPYNTDDQRNICLDGVCGPNNVINGVEANGFTGGFEIATPFAVRPRNALTGAAIPGVSTRYQYLNGCQGLPSYQISPTDLARAANVSAPANGVVCQEDISQLYGNIQPQIERFGGSARATAKVGSTLEAYGEFNFLQTSSSYTGNPATIRGNAPAPFFSLPRYSTSANVPAYGNNTILQLPVFVCASGVNCATAADRRLNPNNPFAAQGQTAALVGRIPNLFTEDMTRTRAFRGALGIGGNLTDKINFDVSATAMHIDLRRTSNGYVRIQNLLDAINQGTYDFVNPFSNSQATLDRLAPTNITNSTSDLFQLQGTLGTTLAELPGGPLQVGVGAAIRYEAVDAPSANSDINGPTQRYYTLNGFATKGNRTVYSAYFEVEAPIIDQFTLNGSGRYDSYSSGQKNFSPKIGAKFTPFRQLAIRGTYSRGFRIPSFGEANATFPTTGFVPTPQSVYTDAFLSQYGCSQATFEDECPAYITGASYGQTSIANPNLKAEKSRSFTAGLLFEPIRNISFTVDYFNIKKTDAITTNFNPGLLAYYSGQAIPAGFDIVQDGPDLTGNFEGATPRVAFVQAQFINANTIKSEGIDFGINANYSFSENARFSSFLEASYILELSTTLPDGTKERYDGTIGNYNLTAGSGTPKWKATWLNTLELGDVLLSGTVNYFDGYDLSAEDQTGPGTRGDCGLAPSPQYVPCRVDKYITVDANLSFKVDDRFTFYVNALNILDDLPPIDVVTYGAHLYNPVQGGSGILGRYFRAGVKVGL